MIADYTICPLSLPIYAHELHDYAKAKVQEVKPKQKPEIIIDKEGFN